VDGTRIRKHFADADAIFEVFADADDDADALSEKKTKFLPQRYFSSVTMILQNSSCICIFAHATLAKTGPGVQLIFISVADSADADTRWLFLRTRTLPCGRGPKIPGSAHLCSGLSARFDSLF